MDQPETDGLSSRNVLPRVISTNDLRAAEPQGETAVPNKAIPSAPQRTDEVPQLADEAQPSSPGQLESTRASCEPVESAEMASTPCSNDEADMAEEEASCARTNPLPRESSPAGSKYGQASVRSVDTSKIIESPAWLPAGWRAIEKTRLLGKSGGKKDKYYIEQSSGRQFRSRNEVVAYLQKLQSPSTLNPDPLTGETGPWTLTPTRLVIHQSPDPTEAPQKGPKWSLGTGSPTRGCGPRKSLGSESHLEVETAKRQKMEQAEGSAPPPERKTTGRRSKQRRKTTGWIRLSFQHLEPSPTPPPPPHSSQPVQHRVPAPPAERSQSRDTAATEGCTAVPEPAVPASGIIVPPPHPKLAELSKMQNRIPAMAAGHHLHTNIDAARAMASIVESDAKKLQLQSDIQILRSLLQSNHSQGLRPDRQPCQGSDPALPMPTTGPALPPIPPPAPALTPHQVPQTSSHWKLPVFPNGGQGFISAGLGAIPGFRQPFPWHGQQGVMLPQSSGLAELQQRMFLHHGQSQSHPSLLSPHATVTKPLPRPMAQPGTAIPTHLLQKQVLEPRPTPVSVSSGASSAFAVPKSSTSQSTACRPVPWPQPQAQPQGGLDDDMALEADKSLLLVGRTVCRRAAFSLVAELQSRGFRTNLCFFNSPDGQKPRQPEGRAMAVAGGQEMRAQARPLAAGSS